MHVKLDLLTPLWTGGADKKSNRAHETGIIGSLRWWYEILVRSLGGYVGDPTAEKAEQRSEFDTAAYSGALQQKRSQEEAIAEGIRTLGAAEYLFGATGWARLFRLRVTEWPRVPLHFRTSLEMNKSWLSRIFQSGSSDNPTIDDQEVIYDRLEFELAFRRREHDYELGQLAFLLRFVQAYGGVGAKLQHGFGQVGQVTLPDEMARVTIEQGLGDLRDKLDLGGLDGRGSTPNTPYHLAHYIHLTYLIPPDGRLHRFRGSDTHLGDARKQSEEAYLPCAFDLRYRGEEPLGFRRWLKEKRGWRESDDPDRLGPLDELMGPRSQWDAHGRTFHVRDELRTASRVCFGMPVRVEDGYRLVLFGFAPPGILSVEQLNDLLQDYMREAFDVAPQAQVWGRNLIAPFVGGPS